MGEAIEAAEPIQAPVLVLVEVGPTDVMAWMDDQKRRGVRVLGAFGSKAPTVYELKRDCQKSA
jgi:hypothetical protein